MFKFEKEAEEILNKHCDCEMLPECLAGTRIRCTDFEDKKKLLLEGIEFGYAHGLKAKVNMTTISDAPLENEKRLAEAKEIIGKLCRTVRTLNNTNTQLTDVDNYLVDFEQFLKERKNDSRRNG